MNRSEHAADAGRAQDRGRGNVIRFPEQLVENLRPLRSTWRPQKAPRFRLARGPNAWSTGEEWTEFMLRQLLSRRAMAGIDWDVAVVRSDSTSDDFTPKEWNGPRLLKAARMPFHPAAMILPMMDQDEAVALTASIKKHGLKRPIITCDDMILDGRNRYYACLAAGVDPLFEEFGEYDDTDPRVYVVIHNVHRRHLSVGFRARLAANLVTTTHGGDRRTDQDPDSDLERKPKRTREDAAQICFVGVQRISDVNYIRNHAEPEVIAQFEADKITLGRAKMLAKETAEEQREAPEVKFAGPRKPKPSKPPTADLAQALVRLNDDDLVEAFEEMIAPRLNRALRPHGKHVVIMSIADDQRDLRNRR